jgi:hypothetical protein
MLVVEEMELLVDLVVLEIQVEVLVEVVIQVMYHLTHPLIEAAVVADLEDVMLGEQVVQE